MFNTQQDLSTFLKMTPNAFHVQSNLVTLIGKPKPFEQKEKPNPEGQDQSRRKRTEHLNNHYIPPNRQSNSQPDSLTSNPSPVQPSSLVSSDIRNSVSPPVSLQQQTLKQRINSLLIKTLAENTERDKSLQNAVIGEALKSRVSQQTKLVVSVRECLPIVDDIMYPRKPPSDGRIVVSFDCEGINIGPKGRLTLVQIGTMSGQVYVFDLITCPNILQSGNLQKLLESEKVIKVGSLLLNFFDFVVFG